MVKRFRTLAPAPPPVLRRPLHQDKARSLEILHEPAGDDLGHDLVGSIDALAALEALSGDNRP